MSSEVSKVISGSIAEEAGIEPGDRLIKINDHRVKDIIDYKFLISDEFLLMEIEKPDGELWEIEIEKDYDDSIGIEFKESIMDKAQSCCNKCIFCFVDQLPKGMRNTLYFKDDDSRLSFLQGNFVTLTNMSSEDIDRIVAYKISPINVSVHTTNPELRREMLNNKNAGDIYEKMKKLAQGGIKINAQIVLCPNINNGEEFIRTVEDLYSLYPAVENVAAVPFGATKYRKDLKEIKMYTKELATRELEISEALQKKYLKEVGKPFLNMADEFYVLSDREVPSEEFYGDYDQLEDGIGMIRNFRSNISNTVKNLSYNKKGSFTFVTGASAFNEILNASKIIMMENPKINVNTIKIINNFFGDTITVAGLITATDIIEQLKGEQIGEYIIIPDVMLRKDYELSSSKDKIFLDNLSINDLENQLNKKILICDYTGEDLIQIIDENCEEE